MPESKVRKTAAQKKQVATQQELVTKQAKKRRLAPATRNWVPYVFVPVGLLGVAWLVVYYIAGQRVPVMSALADWNLLIGMGLLASSFVIATLWK